MRARTRTAAGVLLASLLAVLPLGPKPAAAQGERILTFESVVEVHRNSDITVEEKIRVRAAGGAIKRGIFRDLPRTRLDLHDKATPVRHEILAVLRDGVAEPHFTRVQGDMLRIYIGRSDVLLDPGEYTYTLRYRAGGQIGFFENYDELFWNVTGNAWAFPIDAARGTIRLPPAAGRVVRKAAYTGRAGETGADVRFAGGESNLVTVAATRPLAPGEGLSLAVAWPKGAVAPPVPPPKEEVSAIKLSLTLRADGRVEVAETLDFTAIGQYNIAGIERIIERNYRDPRWGLVRPTGVRVLDAVRGGKPETFALDTRGSRHVVRLGKRGTRIPKGAHRYILRYEMPHGVRHGAGEDYVDWLIRIPWPLQLGEVSGLVTLPPGLEGGRVAVLKRFEDKPLYGAGAVKAPDGRWTFTTRRLESGGARLRVFWPAGAVVTPGPVETVLRLARANRWFFASAAGAALVFLWYLLAWILVGRDPKPGTVIPRFHPPGGFGPAALRFFDKRLRLDDKAMAAAIVNLAVKGHIVITQVTDEDGGEDGYVLRRNPDTGAAESVSGPERALRKALLPELDSELTLTRAANWRVQESRAALGKALRATFARIYLLRHRGWAVPGWIASAAAIVALFGWIWRGDDYFLAAIGTVGGLAATLLVVGVAAAARMRAYLAMAIWGGFALAALAMFAFGVASMWREIGWGGALILAAIFPMNLVFTALLAAPTPKGRKLIDELEGFKLYLRTAEEDVLRDAVPAGDNPSDRTPALFERFLPYAIALDLEQEWGAKFADVIGGAEAGSPVYTATWYAGTDLSALTAERFAETLGQQFAGAVGAAAAVQASGSSGSSFRFTSSTGGGSGSWSSGSSGGGSSGGGGGGGGGGGW